MPDAPNAIAATTNQILRKAIILGLRVQNGPARDDHAPDLLSDHITAEARTP
jgi:hypothetical protein